jgi:ribosome biogenesis GTPase
MTPPNPLPAPLVRIGFNASLAAACAALPHTGAPLARVVERHRAHCVVHTGESLLHARPLPALAREVYLAVGDWVRLAREREDWWIDTCLPRHGVLQRVNPGGERQLLVANVDVAFLVMGLDRDWNPRRLERYLALAKAADVLPVVVLTKADLCADVDAHLDELAPRLPTAIDRRAIVATDPAAVAALRPYLAAGVTAVLLGSSGAGKSTLTNSLAGAPLQSTGAVRESDARGRHTTTSRHLVTLAGGGCVIDTPGLRGLRLDVDPAAVDALFDDVQAQATHCRFRDCTHADEPGCSVREVVAPDRLANYHKLQREAARDRRDPLARNAAKAEMKARQRALRAMQKERGR